jgi:hypothetical protein
VKAPSVSYAMSNTRNFDHVDVEVKALTMTEAMQLGLMDDQAGQDVPGREEGD